MFLISSSLSNPPPAELPPALHHTILPTYLATYLPSTNQEFILRGSLIRFRYSSSCIFFTRLTLKVLKSQIFTYLNQFFFNYSQTKFTAIVLIVVFMQSIVLPNFRLIAFRLIISLFVLKNGINW